MNSKDYWSKREEEALKHYIKDEKEYDKQIQQIYSNMLDNVQKEIDSFYGWILRLMSVKLNAM